MATFDKFNEIAKGEKSAFQELSDIFKRKLELKEGQENNLNLTDLIGTLSLNKDFQASFDYALEEKTGFKPNRTAKFALSSTETAKQVGTKVEPIVDGFLSTNEPLNFLATVNTLSPNGFVKLTERDFQGVGQNLTEVQAGADGFRVTREDDNLIAETKLQASTEITELALTRFDAYSLATFIADLNGEIQTRMKLNTYYGGQGVANGTARGNLWRGIDNNYGVNGTGDATNYIGAIKYATKAAADTALATAGITASTDAYDLCVKMHGLLPTNVNNQSTEYAFIMNNVTWTAIKTVLDANGRYKAFSAVDPLTGRVMEMIDGKRVIIDDDVTASFVFLVPKGFYRIYLTGGIRSLTDNGAVSLREGKTVYVARTFGVGSLLFGHKYRPTTVATIGTTPIDNMSRNAWRYFRIN
jgi:hypothetical protein